MDYYKPHGPDLEGAVEPFITFYACTTQFNEQLTMDGLYYRFLLILRGLMTWYGVMD